MRARNVFITRFFVTRSGPAAVASALILLVSCKPTNPTAAVVPTVNLPYTITLEEVQSPANNLPALQGYCVAPAKAGGWFALGGRITGLHHFDNDGFPVSGQNTHLWYINPATMANDPVFDLTTLPPAVGQPLTGTNQQCYFEDGNWYIAGGYGNDPSTGTLATFDTLIRVPVETVVSIARDPSKSPAAKAAAIAQTIEIIHNPIFRTTGGVLAKTPNYYVLAFGQQFDGQYNPFGTNGVTQVYNEVVSFFTLKPGKLAINVSGSLTSNTTDHPYHRRDFPATMAIDPNTGAPRLAVFAGVFPPGMLAGYTNVVYVSEQFGQLTAKVDNNLNKRFSAYQCPTIAILDKTAKTSYYTFVGGIGHYWYWQSTAQHAIYEEATAQGRNDGLPFTEDIDTVVQKADGSYEEYIAANPIPGNKLRGASVDFLPATGAHMLAGGVVDLNSFADGDSATIGYFYGGIDAEHPFPTVPNTGTTATNALYKVTLARKPWSSMPASVGHESKGISDHTKDAGGH